MADKKCLVYETLGNIANLQAEERTDKGVRMTGIFGVCGIRNENKRIYSKENYGRMVESLQQTILTEGCPGELEHPNTMNIDLNNVSHKIEEIQMNEDGTVTGTILLLNTPKGKTAQAIVEGGLPLYISSRGAGSVDERGNVTLTTIKTFDLVGTPGFSQAKLNLKENQMAESLNESLEDGPISWIIVENDNDVKPEPKDDKDDNADKDDKDDKKKKSDDSEENAEDDTDVKEANSSEDDILGDGAEDGSEDFGEDGDTVEDPKDSEDSEDDDKKTNISKDVTMNDLKTAIDKLTEKISSLEAELHVAQESLANTQHQLDEANDKIASINVVNYDAIESWVKEEFAPEFKDTVITEMAVYTDNWICEEFAPEIEGWITEEFAPEVQNWVCEEFAPEVQNWVCEEFAPEVQNWVCEEFAPEVEGWITEEFAPEVEGWITEEFAPEVKNEINESLNGYLESKKEDKLDAIDKMLESLSDDTKKDDALAILKENVDSSNTFKGVYVVENMPAEYQPQWQLLNEDRKAEIVRSAKLYDFTKKGVLESFWANVKFENEQKVNENVDITKPYQNYIIAQMKAMRH